MIGRVPVDPDQPTSGVTRYHWYLSVFLLRVVGGSLLSVVERLPAHRVGVMMASVSLSSGPGSSGLESIS